MERMLAVVFDNQKKAYQAKAALYELQAEGSITIYQGAVVMKHADGTVVVKNFDDPAPVGTLIGTAVGSLVGLIGGPAGVALGAATGLTAGTLIDVDRFENARVGEDFVVDLLETVTPKKVVVAAEIEEEWTTPVDTRMEALGGTVLRRSMWQVRKDSDDAQIAAMRADLDQFKAEVVKADAERRANLQKKIEALKSRIDARKKKADENRKAFEARQKSKREILRKNAAAAGRRLKDLANTPV